MTAVNLHYFLVGDRVKVDFGLDPYGSCPCECGRSTSYIGTVAGIDKPYGPTISPDDRHGTFFTEHPSIVRKLPTPEGFR